MTSPRSVLVSALAMSCAFLALACKSAPAGGDPQIQAIVDDHAKKHPDILRLTVHMAKDGKPAEAVASTLPDKIGKASDKEDVDAIQTGKTIVLPEPDALDVTVPALQKDGKYTTAIGVTLPAKAGADKKAVEAKATDIANSVANAIAAKK
jgi:hypothetical protein